jgi:hypothetical protein
MRSALPVTLNRAAIEPVCEWGCVSARADGHPVPMIFTVTISFTSKEAS